MAAKIDGVSSEWKIEREYEDGTEVKRDKAAMRWLMRWVSQERPAVMRRAWARWVWEREGRGGREEGGEREVDVEKKWV